MIVETMKAVKWLNLDLEKKSEIENKLAALEVAIRKYTNNNFQNVNIRFTASVENGLINGSHNFIQKGDTIQISKSKVNDGVYTVTNIRDGKIEVGKDLFDAPFNLITKIEYPADIQSGVINLLKWDIQNREKVGIKSETISRHSVTYYDLDMNHELGYPKSLISFLKPYMKARF